MVKKSNHNLFLLGSAVLGLLLGSLHSPLIFHSAEVVSTIFLKFLKFLSLPLVFFAIGSTITSAKNFHTILSLGKKILYYTLLTTILSATIGMVLLLIIRPIMPTSSPLSIQQTINATGYLEVLSKTIPGNILEPFIENNVISATFLSILLGTASLFLPEKEKNFVHMLFSSCSSLLMNLAKGVLKLLIPATMAFGILFYKEISHGQDNLLIFAKYLLCVVGANLLQGFLVLPCLLKWNKLSPMSVAKAMSPALITAFFSKSSATTLPLTMELAEEKLHVQSKLSRIAFPLCSVINMNGCAAFIAITVIFVSMSNGVTFSLLSMLGWIMISTLCAIGNAGVPMGCFFLASSLLTSMHIPLHLLGLILPFYTMLDMIETALNVWSDCCIVSVTDRQFSQK